MHRFGKFIPSTTHTLLAVLALGVWVLAIEHFPRSLGVARAATVKASTKALGTVNVQRVNVKSANGTTRFVISNPQEYPSAKVRGKIYKRSISDAAGMVFYNADGAEDGALGTSMIGGYRQANLIFDYGYQPTDAISMGVNESPDGKRWSAGFSVSDRRPYKPGPIKSSEGVKRIVLGDGNQDSELLIFDKQGRPRIRIGVGKDGIPHIQMLNSHGDVVYNATQPAPSK